MIRSRVIAVASAKGSPGCTFVALGLASRLAGAGLPTLLIDADAEAGSVATMLDLAAPRLPLTPGDLAPVSGAAIDAAAVTAGGGLECIDASGGAFGGDGRLLADLARADHPVVVADLGHRLDRLQRELLAAADWLLWVVAPDRVGLLRADRAIEAGTPAGCSGGIVLNRLGSHCLADSGKVLAERHRLPVLARFGDHPRAAREATRTFSGPDQGWRFRRPFAELARAVHPDAAEAGGRTWP